MKTVSSIHVLFDDGTVLLIIKIEGGNTDGGDMREKCLLCPDLFHTMSWNFSARLTFEQN